MPHLLSDLNDAIGNLGMGPRRSVVVIPRNADSRDPTLGKVAVDTLHLLEYALVMADEVARQHHDVGPERCDPRKHTHDVVVVHARADVHIADLNKRPASEGGRQRRGQATAG